MHLGLDIGTSGVKAVLLDDQQVLVGQASASLSVQRPAPGFSEQDPQAWIDACAEVMDQLDLTRLVSIGLSGQMHGATLLDSTDTVIRPCLLWNDTRAERQAARLNAHPRVHELSGNWMFPGFTAPKLDWIREHQPADFDRVSKVLLPKAFVRLWLSGEYASDVSDASGTGWLNVQDRQFSDELLALSGLESYQMPRLVEGPHVSGQLREQLCQRWGITGTVVIAGGAGDNAATACGLGVTSPGQGFVSLGTSGVLFTPTKTCLPAPHSAVHTFCHALPNRWHHMGVTLSAADSLAWWSSVLNLTPAQAIASLPAILDRPSRVTFLPYLGGERTPHNDAQIRGHFSGLEHVTDTSDMTLAVLQGVAFSLRDCLDALNTAGSDVTRLTAAGGGAASALWLQILADVLQRPIDVPREAGSSASVGAARLAGLAAGAWSEPLTAPLCARTFEPSPNLVDAWAHAFDDYQSLYQANKADAP